MPWGSANLLIINQLWGLHRGLDPANNLLIVRHLIFSLLLHWQPQDHAALTSMVQLRSNPQSKTAPSAMST